MAKSLSSFVVVVSAVLLGGSAKTAADQSSSSCATACAALCKSNYASDQMLHDSCEAGCKIPDGAQASQKDIVAHCTTPFLPKVDSAACEKGASALHTCEKNGGANTSVPSSLQKVCQSATGCFQVWIAPEQYMQLGEAKDVDPGTNYGVDVAFGDYQLEGQYYAQSVFATIQDDDGDHLVNVTRGYEAIGQPSAFCVFDMGAQVTPYLTLVQQHGVHCKFALTETRQPPAGVAAAPVFVYTLSVEFDSSVACGSGSLHPKAPACPQPPQPKVPALAAEEQLLTLQI